MEPWPRKEWLLEECKQSPSVGPAPTQWSRPVSACVKWVKGHHQQPGFLHSTKALGNRRGEGKRASALKQTTSRRTSAALALGVGEERVATEPGDVENADSEPRLGGGWGRLAPPSSAPACSGMFVWSPRTNRPVWFGEPLQQGSGSEIRAHPNWFPKRSCSNLK